MHHRSLILWVIFGVGCHSIDTVDESARSEAELATVAAPVFQAPFACGESWTYSHHSAEVRRALDFIVNGGDSNGRPVLASAAGKATRHFEAGGAGNYISIDHGDGWTTYYFHLSAFSVASGVDVEQGQEIGRVGTTGASSGPHLHYEQLLRGGGQDIRIDNVGLAYPGTYGQNSLKSANCGTATPAPPPASECAVRDGKLWCGNEASALYETPSLMSPVVNQLRTTDSWFECWGKGGPHAKGTTWYRTVGDDNRARGWIPGARLSTKPEFERDPTAEGFAACPEADGP
jgi:hypothetical protein